MWFAKYQALGNDYLVVSEQDARLLTAELVRRVCDRHFGVGSDGILVDESFDPDSRLARPGTSKPGIRGAGSQGPFRLRILNPDGSEAEKSGNGLRIFARFLWDDRRVGDERFAVTTPGGEVWCQVRDAGREVFVEMGQATFDSTAIPVLGPAREVVDEPVEIDGERWRLTAVSVGNPHCVVYPTVVSEELARRLGPRLESSPLFPRRTNVQLVEVLDPHRIRIEIWERGAGYTLASGSSSCAAAAASVRLGHCASPVTVVMPGGELEIEVLPGFQMTMRGPVQAVASGRMSKELLRDPER